MSVSDAGSTSEHASRTNHPKDDILFLAAHPPSRTVDRGSLRTKRHAEEHRSHESFLGSHLVSTRSWSRTDRTTRRRSRWQTHTRALAPSELNESPQDPQTNQ